MATGIGVRQMSTGPRRASSTVHITGLEPGQSAWIEAPWTPTTGGIADADGSLSLKIWYTGEATIRTDDWSGSVVLRPGSWKNFQLQSKGTTAHL